MHHITEYLTQSGTSMTSLFTANPFGFLMKMGESDELASRQSTDSGSMGRKTISDLQVRMMMWEFEAYLNGDHKNDNTSINSACDLGDEGVKPSQFQAFTSLMNSGKSNTYLKEHQGKRLKLEQLCGELHYKSSRKVMAEFRDCVLRANPPLKLEKMTELFEIILAETLEGQREAEAVWRADPRNMNKLSTEYIGNRISGAMRSLSTLFNQTSGKIMPVVDFLLGTDDDDDSETDAHDDGVHAVSIFSGADSDSPRGYDRVIIQGARELERRRAGERHPRCSVRVNDETQSEVGRETLNDGTSRILRPSKKLFESDYVLRDSGCAQQVDRNTNNCADTGIEMEIFGEDIIHDEKTNLIKKEVNIKCKLGKIERRLTEGALCSDDIYLDVQL